MPARNKRGTSVRATAQGPVRTKATKKTHTTYEGGTGYARDAKSELYLLGVANLGQDTFYQPAQMRDSRYAQLIHKVAPADPKWITDFLIWLRTDAGLRTAAVDGVVEAVHALHDNDVPGGRQITALVPGRADEPGAILATQWERYGRNAPMALKNGLADACDRLYTEYALLNYDTDRYAVRFGDVVETCHPKGAENGPLYRYAIDRLHNRSRYQPDGTPCLNSTEPSDRFGPLVVPLSLAMCVANAGLRRAAQEDPSVLLDTQRLRDAGFDWRNLMSLAGSKLDKQKLWEAIIKIMGYQALLMNLRNFDDAGVSDAVADWVGKRLADPARVERGRMFPMTYLAAYRNTHNVRWHQPLDRALTLSLGNITPLKGRTLILIDTSRSMRYPLSGQSDMRRWDAAVIFGCGVARRCDEADVISFSGPGYYYEPRAAMTKVFPLRRGESLMLTLERFRNDGYFLDMGTETALALRQHFAGHNRVIVVTDEQTGVDPTEVSRSIPDTVPMYTWNLAGYRYGHGPSMPNRHTFGGLSDHSFKMVQLLEAGHDAGWPWEVQSGNDSVTAG